MGQSMMMHFMQSMQMHGGPFGQRAPVDPRAQGSTVDLPRPSSTLPMALADASVTATADEAMPGAADGGHDQGLGGGVYAATSLEDLASCN